PPTYQIYQPFASFSVDYKSIIKNNYFTDLPPRWFTSPGIVEASGPLWKENRTAVLSILRAFGMGRNVMAEKVEEEIHAYLEEVDKLDGKPADMKEITSRAVSNIICSFLLGQRFEYGDPYFSKFLTMFDQTVEAASAGTVHAWFPIVRHLPGDLFKAKRMIETQKFFDDFVRDFRKKVDDDETSGINQDNIISHYLKEMNEKNDKGQQTNMSDEGLGRVISDFMIAGSETTTSTILWFFLYMLHYPDVQRKIHEEMDEKIGTERSPKITDRSKMTYLNAAIMETQRIASIVPLGLFHRCTEETTVRGYTIPKDTYIMPHLDSALLSEKIWGDPHNFRPERFIDGKGNLLNPEELVPFSMGRRMCLGEALAKAELFLFTTHILQQYQLEPEHPGALPSFDSVLGITRAPKPFRIRLVKRDALEQ
ncbi:hypothetical protein EGW08_015847, partial [Elysia chlorotica]